MKLTAFIGKQSRPVLVLLGSVTTVLVGVGDYFATNQLLEFSVFFLLPVSFFTWFMGRSAGLFASVVNGASILGVNRSSPTHLKDPDIGYWNAAVWTVFFVVITLIIADLKTLHTRERELARVDSLTGAATRFAFYELARDEANRARRMNQPTTIAYLDIDCFKEINDQNGHSTGDKLLTAVAQGIRECIRSTDMVARMGGDEFALLFPNTHTQAAGNFLDKVLSLLATKMRERGWPVTFSVGAVTFLRNPGSVEEMIESADKIMYLVKQSGKNRLRQEEMAA
jgi:diguanylate cyclase (GGDEF)-like protein